MTTGWLPQRHPCDFPNVICNRHGMVTGVDLAGPADNFDSPGGPGESKLPRLRLKALPEGGSWEALGQMSLQIVRFDNAEYAFQTPIPFPPHPAPSVPIT
jgi:hypothetical protein